MRVAPNNSLLSNVLGSATGEQLQPDQPDQLHGIPFESTESSNTPKPTRFTSINAFICFRSHISRHGIRLPEPDTPNTACSTQDAISSLWHGLDDSLKEPFFDAARGYSRYHRFHTSLTVISVALCVQNFYVWRIWVFQRNWLANIFCAVITSVRSSSLCLILVFLNTLPAKYHPNRWRSRYPGYR